MPVRCGHWGRRGRGAKDARVVANGGADPIGNEVVGVGDDGLLQSLEGDIGVAEAEFLEGNGWVDGDALVTVAKLVEVVEEVVVLGVVGGGGGGGAWRGGWWLQRPWWR